jgi:SAM-dependent methyltransferase
MSYEVLAYYYDELMKEVEYDNWIKFFNDSISKYSFDNKKLDVLDLGCGTGIFISHLSKGNYNVYGLDLSEDMLSIANERLEEIGVSANLLQGNMTEFELEMQFDVITIFCDSLNYLTTDDDVKNTFKQVYKHLKPGGLLMFDVHSLYKINNDFNNKTYSVVEDDYALIWATFNGDAENSVDHELNFFIENDNGMYDKYVEFQQQRTFPIDSYEKWLLNENFTKIEFLGDFNKETDVSTSERIIFCAQKPI